MKNPVAPVLSALVSEHQTMNPLLTSFKRKAVKAATRGLSLGLGLILLVQCLALVQPVSAKSRQGSTVANNKRKQRNRTKKSAASAAKASTEQAQTSRKAAVTPAAKATEAQEINKKSGAPAAQPAETLAAQKAEAQATREAEALANKQAKELAKQEAAELAKKKAEDRAKQQDVDRAGNGQTMGLPSGLTLPANQAASAPAQANTASVPAAPKEIAATNRTVRDLGVVNMQMLGHQKGMIPSSAEPVEVKPINPPQDVPSEGRVAVGRLSISKESKKKKESLDSPISTVPSPMMVRTFRSDVLSVGFIPPDTMGAVGPNHIVTTTNDEVVIYDRNGAVLNDVLLSSFWAVAANSTFDPKVLYDRFNDRFIMVTQVNGALQTSATLIATSQTGDPLGTWNRYSIPADSTSTSTGGSWADYPSMGHNKNWIVISVNRFGYGNRGTGFQGPSIYVINKTTAYAGTLGAVQVYDGFFQSGCLALTADQQPQALGCGFTYVPAITEDNTTNDEYIAEDWDSQFGQLRMTKISGTQVTPTLTVGYQFPQSPYAWRFNASLITNSAGYAPQRAQDAFLPSGTRIAANDSRIQNAVLRNGSFWTTHTVMLARLQTPASIAVGGSANPDIRSGIQWWQIDPLATNTTTGTPPIQRNIIADPRADNCHNGSAGLRAGCAVANQVGDFYSFPNISVNANNDVFVGYSRFSPFTLPKAAYSFRGAGDPANTMRDSITFREGQSNNNVSGGGSVRWGDYSAAMVDPVNDVDFWTIQEHTLDRQPIFSGGAFGALWSTWWALISPTATAPYAFNSGLIISEFRMRGPAGPRDEFVELVNNTNSPITISTTDGSDGWTLVYSDSAGTVTPLAIIPNGTVVPAHGHYLITNEIRLSGTAPYSLSGNPTGNPLRTANSDAMYTPDMADNGGYALFRTSNQANFLGFAVVDAVGFASLPAGSIFREGNGLATCSGAPAAGEQVSFVRKGTAGNPQDTNVNENDFIYTSSTGTSAQNCQVPVTNGAPTPLNRDSPPSP